MAERIISSKFAYIGKKGGKEVIIHKQSNPREVLHFDDTKWDFGEAPNENALKGLMIAAGKTEKLPFDELYEENENTEAIDLDSKGKGKGK